MEIGWTKEERSLSHANGTAQSERQSQEVRCNVVGGHTVLGFVEKTIFHRRGGYHPLAPLRAFDQRTEQCELTMKGKQGQGT